MPIPIADKIQQSKISSVVSEILSLKKGNLNLGTAALETQIDHLVYQLYDLTAEEIAIIENGIK